MTECPSQSDLQRLLEEDLSASQRRTVSGHVQECAACQSRLGELSLAQEQQLADVAPFNGAQSAVELLISQLQQRYPEPIRETDPPLEIRFPGRPTARGALGQLAHYHVIEQIASGGTGVLFRAYDEKLGRVVALKVLKQELASFGEAQARFEREARSVAALKNEHVVTIYDVVNPADFPPYLVLEYIAGESLSTRLKRTGVASPHDAATWVRQVAEGLAAVHRQGVIHRDLKPSNIMLEASTGHAKLTDFGLARDLEQLSELTIEGTLAGTPAYMSPEQIQDPQHVDARSDVYSLGVVLYECLTGEVPFRGQLRMVLWQALQDEPRAPRRLNDRIPHDLETICLKALSKDPQRRYQSAQAIADDLYRWEIGEPVLARPISRFERGWRWCARNRGLAVLAASVSWLLLTGTIGATLAALSLASANNHLRLAQGVARSQANVAADQRDLTLDTLQQMIFEVLDRPAQTAEQLEVRDRLLQIARSGVERVVGTLDEVEVPDLNVVQARMRLGELLAQLGDISSAEAQLEQAEQALQPWVRDADWGATAIQGLAALEWQRGNLQFQHGGIVAAQPLFAEALRIVRDNPTAFLPSSRGTPWLINLEQWLHNAEEIGDPTLQQQTLVVVSDITESLRKLQPRTERWIRQGGIAKIYRARWDSIPQTPPEKIQIAEAGLHDLHELLQNEPAVVGRQFDVAWAQLRLAELLVRQGEISRALPLIQSASGTLEGLTQQVRLPNRSRYLASLARAHWLLGEIAERQHHGLKTVEETQTAAEILEPLLKQDTTEYSTLRLGVHLRLRLRELSSQTSVPQTHSSLLSSMEQLCRELKDHPRIRLVPERLRWLEDQERLIQGVKVLSQARE